MSLIKRNNDYQIDLISANFEFIGFQEVKDDIEIEKVREAERQTIDSYKIRHFDDNKTKKDNFIALEFKRDIYFEPNILYNISVTLNISYELNKEDDKPITEENLTKEVEENKKLLLRPAAAQASLLISNITNADDDLLIVTPPFPKI